MDVTDVSNGMYTLSLQSEEGRVNRPLVVR